MSSSRPQKDLALGNIESSSLEEDDLGDTNIYELGSPVGSSSTSVRSDNISQIEFYSSSKSRCGYCGSETLDRYSYDMKAFRLNPRDYQDLLDKYWRRSGNYCYRPINQNSCCPNYSISCKATKFILSRSQRRCIENLNSFLMMGHVRNPKHSRKLLDYNSIRSDTEKAELIRRKTIDSSTFSQLKSSSKARTKRFVSSCEAKAKLHNIKLEEAIGRVVERNVNRTFKPQLELEHYLYPKILNGTPKHRLRFELHRSESAPNEQIKEEKLQLLKRYQLSIHNETEDNWTMKRYSEFLVESPIIFEKMQNFSHLLNSGKSTSDCQEDYTYSENDSDNYNLLVKPPPLPTHYGTHHCLYYLDDKLIAVGVLDALPKCLTTVYFFYDPNYSHLNLGIYSALVEISMVRQISKNYLSSKETNQFLHYYLGFYVHVCKKMHYKPTFRPSYLLCNETYRYIKTDDCIKKLGHRKYVRFSDDSEPIIERPLSLDDIVNIKVFVPALNITNMEEYLDWLKANVGMDRTFLVIGRVFCIYIQVVGKSLAERMQLRIDILHRSIVA